VQEARNNNTIDDSVKIEKSRMDKIFGIYISKTND